MAPLDSTDIMRQEEIRIEARFKCFGAEVQQAISRVFVRFGHFRPLLTHLQLETPAGTEAQQQTLLRCLCDNGPERFLTGLKQGKNPKKVECATDIQLDHMHSTRTIAAALEKSGRFECEAVFQPPTKPAVERTAAGNRTERRKNSGGRRKVVMLDYPNDRRKTPCRRTNI